MILLYVQESCIIRYKIVTLFYESHPLITLIDRHY